jgi:hypothetical protein
MGRMLVILGVFLILIGIGLSIAPRVPWLGRLPGDIVIKREGFTFYFPLATCILVSLILSLFARIFQR